MTRRLVPVSSQVPDLGVPGVCDAVQIGRGSTATVFRALQPAANRWVAVKVPNERPDAAARLRFEHEAFALGAVSDHPNVLAVHDAGCASDGRPYLVLQFCPGGSLADHVRRRGPLTWPAALRVAVDVADALACAHRSRIVHRDLKPHNVLVSDHGRALLADFGVAAPSADPLLGRPARASSVQYTAPEVLDGYLAAPASDVYSLAATVYFLLTGLAPIPARPDEAWASLYIRLITAPPVRLPNRLPADLRDLLYRSLAKDPSDRPAGAAEFAATAQAVAAAGGAPIEPPTRRDWAGAPIRPLTSGALPRQRAREWSKRV
jgi:serine/threonine protein kinase